MGIAFATLFKGLPSFDNLLITFIRAAKGLLPGKELQALRVRSAAPFAWRSGSWRSGSCRSSCRQQMAPQAAGAVL